MAWSPVRSPMGKWPEVSWSVSMARRKPCSWRGIAAAGRVRSENFSEVTGSACISEYNGDPCGANGISADILANGQDSLFFSHADCGSMALSTSAITHTLPRPSLTSKV